MKTLNLFVFITLISLLISCEKGEIKPTISYPVSGFYGENILSMENTELSGEEFSLAAVLSEGAELKIVITSLDSKSWGFDTGSVENWAITTFDIGNKLQTFTAINDDSKCDLKLFIESKNFRVDYYEQGATEVTFSKIYN